MMNLQTLYLEDINNLYALGKQFLAKEISRNDFKHASGGLGVYSEDCGTRFMTRLRIPAGLLSLEMLHKITEWAESYQLDTVHLTTRQSIQFHGLLLEQVIELLKLTSEIGLCTKGAGGNFPRNVASAPLSGIAKDEAFDIMPYSLLVSEYFKAHMFSYRLPRKLKVCFSNTLADPVHAKIQDIGFVAVCSNGENYFKLYLGGGLGRNPRLSLLYPELIKASEVLYYVEAMIQLFIAEGDYQNKGRARIRYIVERLGEAAFIECFKTHLAHVYDTCTLESAQPTAPITKTGTVSDFSHPRLCAQKQEGLYSVYVHPHGGQLPVHHMKELLSRLETFEAVSLRLAMEESFYIINLTLEEAQEILQLTDAFSGNTQVSYSVACIGKPICQLGILNTQSVLNNIHTALQENGYTQDILPEIHMSGCPNSCGTHQIAPIGFSGKKKKINDTLCNVYECTIKGEVSETQAILGTSVGDIKEEKIPAFICWLYEELNKTQSNFREWIATHESDFTTHLETMNA